MTISAVVNGKNGLQKVLSLALTEDIVTAESTSGSAGSASPNELVSISYTGFKASYYTYDAAGAQTGTTVGSYSPIG